MVEPVQAAAVADELCLLDFIDRSPPRKPCSSNPIETSAAFLQNPNSLLFDDLLDSSVDSIPGLSPPPPPAKNSPPDVELKEEEEEELEWLANKDAFPSLETSFEIATNASPVSVPTSSFKVPVKARSKLSRKRRRIFPPPPLLPVPPQPPAAKGVKERRRCRHCEVEETPQWRMGPEGPKTLCNACGVRYTKGRLFPQYRPANSPTFSAGIHSNSTRKIKEMRLGTGLPGKRGRPWMAVM